MDDSPTQRLTNGGITVGQRFDRLEARMDRSQDRIDEGFRLLANQVANFATRPDLDAVRSRLEAMERNGSWHVQDLIRAKDTADLERTEIRKRLEAIEQSQGNTIAVTEAIEVYKRWLIATALTVAGLVLIVVTNFFTIHRF